MHKKVIKGVEKGCIGNKWVNSKLLPRKSLENKRTTVHFYYKANLLMYLTYHSHAASSPMILNEDVLQPLDQP